jgi:hypothetical protein
VVTAAMIRSGRTITVAAGSKTSPNAAALMGCTVAPRVIHTAAGEQCPAVAHGKGIVGGGGQWQANQAMVAHFENTVLKPWEPAAAITRVECPFAVVCDGIDELSSVDGMGHLLSGVGSSLSVIGVEKMWLGVAMGNRCELPGQVLGVAHATAHSLAVEGWHLMGRVSCEEDGSITETLGDDSVKAIGGYAVDLQLIRAAPLSQQPIEETGFKRLIASFVRLELELPPSTSSMSRHERDDPFGITMLAGDQWQSKIRVEQSRIDDQPFLVELLVDEFDTDEIAHGALRSIGTNQPATAQHCSVAKFEHDAVLCHHKPSSGNTEPQVDSCVDRRPPEECLDAGLVEHGHRWMAEWSNKTWRVFDTDDSFTRCVNEIAAEPGR